VHDEGASEPLAVGRELCDRLKRINDAIEHEPVAWAVMEGGKPIAMFSSAFTDRSEADAFARMFADRCTVVPLYAAPPQDRVVRLPRRRASACGGKYGDGWTHGFAEAMYRVELMLSADGVKWKVSDE
jgi:hypothetical protein